MSDGMQLVLLVLAGAMTVCWVVSLVCDRS